MFTWTMDEKWVCFMYRFCDGHNSRQLSKWLCCLVMVPLLPPLLILQLALLLRLLLAVWYVCVLCYVKVTLRHTAPHYADAECQNKSRFRRRFTTYFWWCYMLRIVNAIIAAVNSLPKTHCHNNKTFRCSPFFSTVLASLLFWCNQMP